MEIANFIANTNFNDLPKKVVEQTKICILDFLGVTIDGSRTLEGRIVADFVRELGCREEATIIGYADKTTAPLAALANGTMCHIVELDDQHRTSGTHPAGPVISAALATAERERASGRDLIVSVVLGYDILLRLGEAMNYASSAHFKRGFRATGTCGTIAAATASGKILGLSAEKMASAMGLGGVQASGIWDFTMGKDFLHGWAAQNGVIAALLSQRGFEGSTKVLEADRGFFSAFSDERDRSKLTEGLGEKFKIMGVSFKRFACSRAFHAALDATEEIVQKHAVKPEEIEKITVRDGSPPKGETYLKTYDPYEPKDIGAAGMSLPFSIALLVYEGRLASSSFVEERLRDARILELARKVGRILDPEFSRLFPERRAALVEIRTKDGRTLSHRVDYPKGDPENPMTKEEFEAKFRECSSTVLDSKKVNELLKIINTLEDLDNVTKLSEYMRVPNKVI